MQPRLVSKFAFVAWNVFTSNFISASKVENVSPLLSHQRCRATTGTQELPGTALSMLTPWQTGRFEHGSWMVGQFIRELKRIKAEVDEQGVAVWWDCISVLSPRCSPKHPDRAPRSWCSPCGSRLCRTFSCRFWSLLCRILTHPRAWHSPETPRPDPAFAPITDHSAQGHSGQRGDPAWEGDTDCTCWLSPFFIIPKYSHRAQIYRLSSKLACSTTACKNADTSLKNFSAIWMLYKNLYHQLHHFYVHW